MNLTAVKICHIERKKISDTENESFEGFEPLSDTFVRQCLFRSDATESDRFDFTVGK